jgi:hypothetical protein
VKKVRSTEDPTVLEITRWIEPGANLIRMAAVKNIPEQRVSMSPTDTMEIFIGAGNMGGATVNIERVLASFTRTAAETAPVTEEFTVHAR